MNNRQRSKMLINAALESLAEAEFSFKRKVYGLPVRRSQEAVELALSSTLAYYGIHFPKNHDQAPLLLQVLKANGVNLGSEAKTIEEISLELSRKRGPALHQEEGYDKAAAFKAINEARVILEIMINILPK